MTIQFGKNNTSKMSGKGWDKCMLEEDYVIATDTEVGIITLENGHRNVALTFHNN
jgi:hypothetical protein